MRKTSLRITHEEVTKKSLDELVSGHGVLRKGLRIAILQGIIDKASITELSRRHHLSREGIYLIVRRVNERGLSGLDEEKRPGRTSQLTKELRKELSDVIIKPPHEFGYRQTRWDGPLLNQYLEEHHNIHLGHSQINRWFHALGYTLQRGRQNFTKANSQEQELFVTDIKKKLHEPNKFELYVFFDEAGISLDPTIASQWAPKGKQPLFPSDSRRERVHLGGLVNPLTGDAFVQRIKKGDSVSFIGILEWISKLYQQYNIIHVYVDNARWHKSKIVRFYLSFNSRIKLDFIPPYSPHLNPVEWEWHELRRITTHAKRFQSSDECYKAVEEHFKSRKGINHMYCQNN